MGPKRIEPVSGYSAPEIAHNAGAIRMSYSRGSRLFHEGQLPRGVFVMYDGLAELSIAGDDGKSLFVGLATPGEMLGVSETISGKPCAMTVTAIRPCEVGLIERDDFLRYISEHRSACFQTIRRLSKDLNMFYRRARAF